MTDYHLVLARGRIRFNVVDPAGSYFTQDIVVDPLSADDCADFRQALTFWGTDLEIPHPVIRSAGSLFDTLVTAATSAGFDHHDSCG